MFVVVFFKFIFILDNKNLVSLTLHFKVHVEISSWLGLGDGGNSGCIVIWEKPWELKNVSTWPWISVYTCSFLYMICPVNTSFPGVKVQVWTSCKAKIPGNFWRRNFLSNETSTFPVHKVFKAHL